MKFPDGLLGDGRDTSVLLCDDNILVKFGDDAKPQIQGGGIRNLGLSYSGIAPSHVAIQIHNASVLRAQAETGVRARSARKGAKVDKSRPCVA